MKMPLIIKALFIFLSALILSSCGPIYKIGHDFTPPKSKAGLQCLRGCQSQLKQCNNRCQVKHQQCAVKSEQQAKKVLPGLQQAYPQQLKLWQDAKRQYERDLDWYEFQRDMEESRRDWALSSCYKSNKKRSDCDSRFSYRYHDDFFYDRPSFNIPRPIRPTLASESAKIRKLSCHQECGCQSNYRLCYTSCGGVVNSKKICVKNCSK